MKMKILKYCLIASVGALLYNLVFWNALGFLCASAAAVTFMILLLQWINENSRWKVRRRKVRKFLEQETREEREERWREEDRRKAPVTVQKIS